MPSRFHTLYTDQHRRTTYLQHHDPQRFGCLALSLFLASVSSLGNTALGSNDANEPHIRRDLQVSTTPTTSTPTRRPTTSRPTRRPTTSRPTRRPTTSRPTRTPTNKPADGSVIGVIGVPIIPRTNAHVTVQLPPSMSNQLITMSQVSSDNEDEVPVVSDVVSYSIFRI